MERECRIETTENPRYVLIRISGEINFKTILMIKPVVEAGIRAKQGSLLLDIREVAHMDSAGIGLFTNTGKLLSKKRGKLGLIVPFGNIRELLEIAAVDSFADMYENLIEAENSIK